MLAKSLLGCQSYIIDLREASNKDIEIIWKALEYRCNVRKNGNNKDLANINVVVIGSHMTWAHRKNHKIDQINH